jgi:hypothetical protein
MLKWRRRAVVALALLLLAVAILFTGFVFALDSVAENCEGSCDLSTLKAFALVGLLTASVSTYLVLRDDAPGVAYLLLGVTGALYGVWFGLLLVSD